MKRKSAKVNTHEEWIKDLSSYLFLALLVVIKFWDFLIPKDKFYWINDFLEVTAMRDYFYHNLRQGVLVLWNSHIASGMPYLAADYGAFYPIDFLMGILFPHYFDPYRLSIIHAIHFWLAGVFTYLYTRQLGLSRYPALLSSICFMLGGFLLGHAGHRNVIQTCIWLPLILYFLDKGLLQRKAFWAVLAGVFLAISFLAGHANFFYFILLFLAFYFLFRIYLRLREKSLRNIAGDAFYFMIMGAFCLGISAIQLVPILFTSLNTHHGTLPFDWKAQLEFPLFNLVHFLIPEYTQWTATDIGEQYGYIGILPLIFAVWGIFQSKDLRIKFFGLVALFSFFASLGDLTPLYKILYDFLPGLKQFRIPARLNALIIFPLAIMVGYGFQHFLEEGRNSSNRIFDSIINLLYFFLIGGIIILLILFFYLTPQNLNDPLWGPWRLLKKGFLWFLFIWGASFLLIFWKNQDRSGEHKILSISFLMLVSLDLLFLGRIDGAYSKINPTLPSSRAEQILMKIEKSSSTFRVNNFKGLLPFLYHQPSGISVYDAGNLLGYVGMVVPQEYLKVHFLSEKNPMLFDLLNIKYHVGVKPDVPNGLKIWKLGGEFADKKFELKNSTKISSLALTSFLSSSTEIPQGTEVARMNLIKPDGSIYPIPIRAGIETAEWAMDRPGLTSLHQKAKVAESWEISGEGYKGHAYAFEINFPRPLEISKIELTYLSGQGGLLIKKIWSDNQEIEGILKDRFQLIGPNLYENIYCLPRIFMIGKAWAIPNKKELLERMEQLDPKEAVLLPRLPAAYHEPRHSLFSTQEAKLIQYSPEKIKIVTYATEDKFLVLSDTYSPFWKAWIDQNPAPILKINYGLRGLYVPKGDHRIVFSFHFYPFYYGLVITCTSLLVFIILTFRAIRWNPRKGKEPSHENKVDSGDTRYVI